MTNRTNTMMHCFISSKLTLSLLLTAMTVLHFNARSQSYDKAIQRFLAEEDLKGASIGFCMLDLESREVIAAHNEDISLSPASSVKTLVTHHALEAFGPDHRFKTELIYAGMLGSKRTLTGDLIVKGYGDPTLGSSHLKQQNFLNEWVMAIRNAGILNIDGNIVVDDSYFEGPPLHGTTPIEDAGNYYAAGAHGVNVFDNSYTLTLRSGAVGDTCEVVSVTPDVKLTFDCHVTASSEKGDNAYIYGIPRTEDRVIFGTIPQERSAFEIRGAMGDPALELGRGLKMALELKGINISGEVIVSRSPVVRPKEQVIFTTYSPPLSEIVYLTNRKSINLFASCLLKHLGMKAYEVGSFESGVRALTAAQKRWMDDLTGFNVVDGSGLSRANALTARQLATGSCIFSQTSETAFVESLIPHATLKGVKVKSGYIERVRAYTGRLTLKDGREVAFAVMVNNYSCSPTQARRAIERFLESLTV